MGCPSIRFPGRTVRWAQESIPGVLRYLVLLHLQKAVNMGTVTAWFSKEMHLFLPDRKMTFMSHKKTQITHIFHVCMHGGVCGSQRSTSGFSQVPSFFFRRVFLWDLGLASQAGWPARLSDSPVSAFSVVGYKPVPLCLHLFCLKKKWGRTQVFILAKWALDHLKLHPQSNTCIS